MIIRQINDRSAEAIPLMFLSGTKDDLKSMLKEQSQAHYYVAEINGRVAGMGVIELDGDSPQERCLLNVFAFPEYQGHRIEQQIMEVMKEDEYALRAKRMKMSRNSFLDIVFSRHSYRGIYKPDPVPREHLKKIMEAGLAAPSGCNKQTTSLIAVDDAGVLKKIHDVIDPPIATTAPAMICVLTQRIIAYRDRCFATQDYSAAIENMLLMVTAMGYQSCWYEGHITDEDRIGDKIARILGVPDTYELVCVLPVGIAEEEPRKPKKQRFEERSWFNRFGGI